MHVLTQILPADLPAFFNGLSLRWHAENSAQDTADDLPDMFTQLHRANFDLWHQEDMARDPYSSDGTIAAVKRSIDRINQRRNDLVEKIDLSLLEALGLEELPRPSATLHSETPGLMLDRLSILSLKIFHTGEQVHRPNTTAEHITRNQARLEVLVEQQNDLAACLHALWIEVLAGTRRFKLYQQLKMYNDPDLNPVLHAQANPSMPPSGA